MYKCTLALKAHYQSKKITPSVLPSCRKIIMSHVCAGVNGVFNADASLFGLGHPVVGL